MVDEQGEADEGAEDLRMRRGSPQSQRSDLTLQKLDARRRYQLLLPVSRLATTCMMHDS